MALCELFPAVIGFSSECDPTACPPTSPPSCRDDQFLVEVRGEKPCCYSFLCGTSSHHHHHHRPHLPPSSHAAVAYTNKPEPPSPVFSLPTVCESCTEPVPACAHGEVLAVDVNNTYSCCPHYYCGERARL